MVVTVVVTLRLGGSGNPINASLHLGRMGASSQVALCAASLAVAAVPECPCSAADHVVFPALAGSCVALPGDALGVVAGMASRAASMVGSGAGHPGNAKQHSRQHRIRRHGRVRSGGGGTPTGRPKSPAG